MKTPVVLQFRHIVLIINLLALTFLVCCLYMFEKPHLKFRPPIPKKVEKEESQITPFDKEQLLLDDVTLVTSYLNLGAFQKGEALTYTPKTYHQWMTVFRLIRNPVVAYFDQYQDLKMFKTIRSTLPTNITKVVKISKYHTWAFTLHHSIADIFSQPSYPKHHPNTVLPDYSCAMHAKYEFVEMALKENPFHTKYFAWLDLGLFRSLVNKSTKPFQIHLPPKFDAKKVAYAEVYPLSEKSVTAKEIVERNMVWVCGCFFVAKYDVMQQWTKQYRAFTEKMIKLKWISTDQQVLYYMFQPQNNKSELVNIHIQAFKSDGRFNPWFHLAYMSSKPWTKKNSYQ